jgi:hypothetical protein
VSAVARKALTLLFKPLARTKVSDQHYTVMLEAARRLSTPGQPVSAEILAEALGLPLDVVLSVVDQVVVDLVLDEQAAGSKDGAAALRYVEQAVRCLPPAQRARYRHEWRAELASLPITHWAPYAIGLLQSSPQLSIALSWPVRRRRPA